MAVILDVATRRSPTPTSHTLIYAQTSVTASLVRKQTCVVLSLN